MEKFINTFLQRRSEPEEIPCDIPLEHSLDPETPIEEMEGAIIKYKS